MKIEWKQHQLNGIQWCENKTFSALFFDTGTGKTAIGLELLERWINQEKLWPALIVCPNGLVMSWYNEAKKWNADLRILPLKHYIKESKLMGPDPPLTFDVAIINYESLAGLKEKIKAMKFKVVIYDEMQRLKSRKSLAVKAMNEITKESRSFVHRVGLSGTPIIHSPLDLWSECNVLAYGKCSDPLGFKTFPAYKNAIANITPHWRVRGVEILDFQEEKFKPVREKIAKFALECSKENCLDLPPRTWQKIIVHMTGDQMKYYKDMAEEAVVALEGSDLRASAPHVVTQIQKLQRITSGHLKMDDKTYIDFESAKITALKALLEQLEGQGKVIIFARFTRDIERICKILEKDYLAIYGKFAKDAASIGAQFVEDPSVRYLVANPQPGGIGLNLQVSRNVIYFSNSHHLEHRLQSQDRVYRIGQKHKVTYYDIIAKNSIDEDVLDNLEGKKEIAEMAIKDLAKKIQKSVEESQIEELSSIFTSLSI